MRYALRLAYAGEDYQGWQVQPSRPSVQAVLSDRISTILKEEVMPMGCGRTDTGVHARRFYAHIDVSNPLEGTFIHKVNRFLPHSIAVDQVWPVNDDWHARFSAQWREYRYFISRKPNPFIQGRVVVDTRDYNLQKMKDALHILPHYKDFGILSKFNVSYSNYLCNLTHARFIERGDLWIFTFRANRFLRGMVRIVVGTLLEIGKGNLTLAQLERGLQEGDRSVAGGAAPAHGLYLWEVGY